MLLTSVERGLFFIANPLSQVLSKRLRLVPRTMRPALTFLPVSDCFRSVPAFHVVFRDTPLTRIHGHELREQVAGRLFFATDFDLAAIDAIRYAASFSQVAGSSLHCLHVIPQAADSAERTRTIPKIMDDALQHVVTESGAKIKTPICVTTYGNEISDAIVDFARRERAKLIVQGVRKASMAASRVPSHLAYQIISAAPCPVMTIAFASRPHEIHAVA